MERAGAALAEAAYRFAGPMPALILCGPGNNGGDGYVAARHLAERGVEVRVAALAEPKSDAAKWARSQWNGEVETLSAGHQAAPLLIDALFGTGLKRGLEDAVSAAAFASCATKRVVAVACDLPSGVESDSGAELSAVPDFDLTVTFGALKPAHRLIRRCTNAGASCSPTSASRRQASGTRSAPPELPPLDPGGHKYDRGLVHALAGKMPGAIALAAKAAARAGRGLCPGQHLAHRSTDLPSAIVQTDTATVNDERIGCLLVGPGHGRHPAGADAGADVARRPR